MQKGVDMKVVIKDENGRFLSRVRGEIAFVDRKERAFVYDLNGDRVEDQLAIAKEKYDSEWSWEDLGDVQAVDGLPKNKWDGKVPK
jgi:hypothetical protein